MTESSNPLPSLRDAKDLLQKAKLDLEAFNTEPGDYHLFNLLCSLNHISDWILKDPSMPLSVSTKVVSLTKEKNVDLIRQLCNRVKHFRKRNAPNIDRTGFGVLPFGVGRFGVAEYFIQNNDELLLIQDICVAAYKVWEVLLSQSD